MLRRGIQSKLPHQRSRSWSRSVWQPVPKRGIKFHEYQAAALLQKYGIPVPAGVPVFDSKDAYKAVKQLNQAQEYVVKAQVHGGGRGLGYFKENGLDSGVHICDSAEKAAELSKLMIGHTLVTKQSGQAGFPCNAVYIVEKLNVAGEMYIAITLDRKLGCPTLVYTPHGGVSIEEVAAKDPSKIFKLPIRDLVNGPDKKELQRAGKEDLKLTEQQTKDFVSTGVSLFKCFMEKDADLIEINPMTVNSQGKLMALDAKITVDDNAAFRQKEIAAEEDKSAENQRERLARVYDLSYIHLDGNIGCLVNGAGLAMATMDIIKVHGGSPANFLDIGGSAESEQIIEAIKLLNHDPNVKSIFVNIFGGILRTDLLVQSIIDASQIESFEKPIVLRMKGTNADIASKLLEGKEKQLGIHFDDDFDKAAKIVVQLSK